MASKLTPAQKGQRSKAKRFLPSIPMESDGVKRAVTFNTQTIETSIGGTQTAGKTKGDPLSPVNRLSTDETGLRSDSWEQSRSEESENHSASQDSLEDSTLDSSVTVQISVSKASKVREEEKENCPETPVNIRTSVTRNSGNTHNSYIDEDSFCRESVDRSLDMIPVPDPGLGIKIRTPLRRHTLDEKLLATPECYNVVHLDKPRFDMSFRDFRSGDEEDSCSVTVAVRVRPYSQKELADPGVKRVVSMSGNETTVQTDGGVKHRFAYDFSFNSFDPRDPEFVGQEPVYTTLGQPLLLKAFEGYNTCLFAYGQTGSGKSYSIMGHGSEVGIIPRFCEELFARADIAKDHDKVKIHAEISFFEIYNEKIHDLLASSKEKGGKKSTLKVREHPVLGPYVEGLSTFIVNSFDDVEGWITLGNKNRATAATGMNDKSSRSHSVFTIVLTQTRTEELEGQEHDHSITSKINLVDLAGSERQSQAQTSGERLREGANINKSLLTLGKVISQLAEQSVSSNKKKKVFIPYRDSVLTWLLKESLGGNSKTAMIATISPANHHTEETLSTLRYAKTARSIVNVARVNEDPKAKLIRELRGEIERLRGNSGTMNEIAHAESLAEIASLKDQLRQKEMEMEEVTRSWQQKLQQSEERKLEEARQLEKAGVTLKVDNKLPNLVNLNEDPQLSEMLLYVIKEGNTRVGRMGHNSKHDIQLSGALIADNHCVISNVQAVVSVTPVGEAPTYVNGNLITDPTILRHGDRVILGGDHYFRFNHPMEVQRNKKENGGQGQLEVKDFEFARTELIRVQESRLQAELEEARRAAQQEMMEEVERAKKEAELELTLQKSDYDNKLSELEKLMKEQSSERDRAEEERQQAEDVIHKLKKQKMMLEQEVLVGRKRQQLETEAALKASSEMVCEKSRLLELLETEKAKAAERLEKLKQRRNELFNSQKRSLPIVEVSPGKTDLYKIALQIREANKISQYLKKHTVFTREDFMDGEAVKTLIKVTNNKLDVCTHWTLNKFEEKLIAMRDLYQNDAENSTDDDVFNGPDDAWEKNEHNTSLSSPHPRIGHRRSFPSPAYNHSLFSSDSSPVSRKGSVASKDYNCGNCSLPTVASLCRDLVGVVLDQFQASFMEESIADKVLHCCHSLKQSVTKVMELPVVMETNNNQPSKLEIIQMHSINMTTYLPSLMSNCSMWFGVYQNLESALIQDVLQKMVEQVKVIGNQMVLFFQGCENEIDSLVQESGGRILDSVHCVCKLTGELALATNTEILYFEKVTSPMLQANLQSEICQSFFCGCETFIDKTLQGALRTVEDFELRTQSLMDFIVEDVADTSELQQCVEIVVSSCKVLLQKCQEIQVEIDSSVLEPSACQPVELCGANYRNSQAIISHVSSLVESLGLLIQHAEPVIQGREQDLRRVLCCAELVQNGSVKVTSVCQNDVQRLRSSSVGMSESGDSSRLSSSQVEQLEYTSQDVQASVNSLLDCVKKMQESQRAVTSTATPRGKRLLPSQPVTGISPQVRTIHE